VFAQDDDKLTSFGFPSCSVSVSHTLLPNCHLLDDYRSKLPLRMLTILNSLAVSEKPEKKPAVPLIRDVFVQKRIVPPT